MNHLHSWFLENRREFPWREVRTPYRVLVSEIMLQQTRASVVIPYFERWMKLFPSVESLAKAPMEQVIKAWEGLGYYSRARNLHAAARQIVEQFGGEIPDCGEKLATIRGLGPYTVGAILSFGFQKRAVAIDGNVARVLSRYFLIDEEISKASTKRKLTESAEFVLDEKEPWVTAEALIELGASICTPRPRCEACPLQAGCAGLKSGRSESLPIKKGQAKATELFRFVFLIEAEGALLVKKGEAGRVMADLYEFPFVERGDRSAEKELLRVFKIRGQMVPLTPQQHSFTRYLATLYPYHVRLEKKCLISGFSWVEIDEIEKLPFSSGHRKLLKTWMDR